MLEIFWGELSLFHLVLQPFVISGNVDCSNDIVQKK